MSSGAAHLDESDSNECDLNPSEKIELETALSDIINHDQDQVILVELGRRKDEVTGWLLRLVCPTRSWTLRVT